MWWVLWIATLRHKRDTRNHRWILRTMYCRLCIDCYGTGRAGVGATVPISTFMCLLQENMWSDPHISQTHEWETGTEAAQFQEKEYINSIFVAVPGLCTVILYSYSSPSLNTGALASSRWTEQKSSVTRVNASSCVSSWSAPSQALILA